MFPSKRVKGYALVCVASTALACNSETVKPATYATTPSKPDSAGSSGSASFFVSSDTSEPANLGGPAGADARCERLAVAANLPKHAWRAYLSVEHAGLRADGGGVGPLDAWATRTASGRT